MNGKHPYADILDHPRHISAKRAQMPRETRAAQFSPFAALTGYDGVIRETARLTEQEVELAEEGMAQLNGKLLELMARIGEQPQATFRCFRQDRYKAGGNYVHITGCVRRIDTASHRIHLTDGTEIPMDCVYDITFSE